METFLININDLVRADIQIPDEQRIVLPETVSQIEEYQETHFKKHKHFNFLGTLNINFCQEQNSYYLMDGQHRYSAIKRLHRKQYHNEKVKVELITVPTFNDVLLNYKLINKNTPLPEWSPNIDENIPKQVFASLLNEYPNIWKKSKKPKRPYINYNDFQEALSYLTEQLNTLKQTAYTNIPTAAGTNVTWPLELVTHEAATAASMSALKRGASSRSLDASSAPGAPAAVGKSFSRWPSSSMPRHDCIELEK